MTCEGIVFNLATHHKSLTGRRLTLIELLRGRRAFRHRFTPVDFCASKKRSLLLPLTLFAPAYGRPSRYARLTLIELLGQRQRPFRLARFTLVELLGGERAFRHRFTLIELLVVIVIISVLASMLLPTLVRARETARRVACLSNMKQLYAGMVMYAGESDGYPASTPVQYVGPTNYGDSEVYRARTESAWNVISFNPTGWYVLEQLGYVAKPVMICPSQDFKGDFDGRDLFGNQTETTRQGLFGIHYSYRYNSARAVFYGNSPDGSCPFDRKAFSGDRRASWSLASDAADYRGVSIGGIGVTTPIGKTVGPWGYAFTRKKWAHGAGGNVLAHDGHAWWQRNNAPPFNTWTFPSANTPRFYYGIDRFL